MKDFETFLKRVDGLKLSRAYDLLRLAGGRTTDEELKKDARERQQKSRAKKKKQPKPEPISVTDPHVTESPMRKPTEQKVFDSPQEAHDQSARAVREFIYATQTWLPKMTLSDLGKATDAFLEISRKMRDQNRRGQKEAA